MKRKVIQILGTLTDLLVKHLDNLKRVIHCYCPKDKTHVQLSSVCVDCEYFSGVMSPLVQQLDRKLKEGAILKERYLSELDTVLQDPKNFYVQCKFLQYPQCNYVESEVRE